MFLFTIEPVEEETYSHPLVATQTRNIRNKMNVETGMANDTERYELEGES